MHAVRLSKASNYFFLLGCLIAKMQYIPIAGLSIALNASSLFLYLTAYSLWFISSHLYPEHPPHIGQWYGFASLKKQYLWSAALGIMATGMSIAGIFFPPLLIGASWCFLISNIIWAVSEYHKLKNPPAHENNFSENYQQSYLFYAITLTLMNFTTALCATLMFFFPPIVLPLIIINAFFFIVLGMIAFEKWMDCVTAINTLPSPSPSPSPSSSLIIKDSASSLQRLGGYIPNAEIIHEPPHDGKTLNFQSSKESLKLYPQLPTFEHN